MIKFQNRECMLAFPHVLDNLLVRTTSSKDRNDNMCCNSGPNYAGFILSVHYSYIKVSISQMPRFIILDQPNAHAHKYISK